MQSQTTPTHVSHTYKGAMDKQEDCTTAACTSTFSNSPETMENENSSSDEPMEGIVESEDVEKSK